MKKIENEREDSQLEPIVCEKNGKKFECITIIGQIEGHFLLPENQKTTKYEHMIPLITSIEQDEETAGVLILINTVGGDVEAGLALSELIAGMSKPSVSLVLGGGHSIGVPLSVCADRSLIVPSATMTIHPVRVTGTVVGVPQSYTYFQRMQERITNFICRHSRCPKEKFLSLLQRTDEIATDVGSIVDGEYAVEIGLIDRIGGLRDALSELKALCEINSEKGID